MKKYNWSFGKYRYYRNSYYDESETYNSWDYSDVCTTTPLDEVIKQEEIEILYTVFDSLSQDEKTKHIMMLKRR